MRDERKYVLDVISGFLNGSSDEWDWGEFTSCTLRSARLDDIRRRAGAIDLPLDAEGKALLQALRSEANSLAGDDLTKPKPWRMDIGLICGLLAGAPLWWSRYVPGEGVLQNPRLLLVPAAMGVLAVTVRNRRKRVGEYDPEMLAKNERGRV